MRKGWQKDQMALPVPCLQYRVAGTRSARCVSGVCVCVTNVLLKCTTRDATLAVLFLLAAGGAEGVEASVSSLSLSSPAHLLRLQAARLEPRLSVRRWAKCDSGCLSSVVVVLVDCFIYIAVLLSPVTNVSSILITCDDMICTCNHTVTATFFLLYYSIHYCLAMTHCLHITLLSVTTMSSSSFLTFLINRNSLINIWLLTVLAQTTCLFDQSYKHPSSGAALSSAGQHRHFSHPPPSICTWRLAKWDRRHHPGVTTDQFFALPLKVKLKRVRVGL